MTDTAKATEVSEFVRICRAHKKRTGAATPLVLFQNPDEPFYRFESADGDAKLSFTALAAVSDEYAALKAVEAAAREIETITQGYIDGYRSGQPFVIEGKQTEARERLQAALAALDAIRTPDDGKRGGARL